MVDEAQTWAKYERGAPDAMIWQLKKDMAQWKRQERVEAPAGKENEECRPDCRQRTRATQGAFGNPL
jgi:hypothetical protein